MPTPGAASILEPRVAALEAAVNAPHAADEGADRSATLLAAGALALAAIALIGGIAFFFGVWRPHQASVSGALQRVIPDALRAQSQEVSALKKQSEAAQRQWEQDRDALRRGQELLASHTMPPGASSGEAERLRREVEALRRSVTALEARGVSSEPPQPETPSEA